MTKSWLALALALLAALFCLYATLYFAWLSATPLTEAQLHRVQYDCYVWFWVFVAAALLVIGLAARLVWLYRCRPRREPAAHA